MTDTMKKACEKVLARYEDRLRNLQAADRDNEIRKIETQGFIAFMQEIIDAGSEGEENGEG